MKVINIVVTENSEVLSVDTFYETDKKLADKLFIEKANQLGMREGEEFDVLDDGTYTDSYGISRVSYLNGDI